MLRHLRRHIRQHACVTVSHRLLKPLQTSLSTQSASSRLVIIVRNNRFFSFNCHSHDVPMPQAKATRGWRDLPSVILSYPRVLRCAECVNSSSDRSCGLTRPDLFQNEVYSVVHHQVNLAINTCKKVLGTIIYGVIFCETVKDACVLPE